MSNINTAKIDEAMSFIDVFSGLSKDEATKEWAEKIKKSVANAKDAMADNEEKAAILLNAVTSWANQLAFTLFREGSLTEEAEIAYRSLPPVQETTDAAKAFAQARNKEVERINDERAAVVTEEKGIEIFTAIVGGMDKETAKAKMEEYEKQLEQAKAQTMRG